MTYLAFHLVFLLPPLLILLATGFPRPPRLWAYLLMPLIALVYTTPWDNYLVWQGVWGYPEGRVLLRLGYVPLEEYLFFLLQPLLTGAFLHPKRMNWVVGCSLLFLAIFAAYTGYLLPMDPLAYWATQTGMELLRALPLRVVAMIR